MLQPVLRALVEGRPLEPSQVASAVEEVLEARASTAQVAALATALRMRGETAEEIAASARALRALATTLDIPGDLLDTCGTGGGPAGTFNVSTVAAIVASACGVRVAKHGLRAVTSRTGSADVCEALGVRINAPREVVVRCLLEVGLAFFYAPVWHVSLANAAVVRQELGFRTIFDLLVPLSNPAGASHQLLGVHSRAYLRPMAEALRLLGGQHAWVLHGHGGVDEVSTSGPTEVLVLSNGVLSERSVVPEDFGLERHDTALLKGGDPATNAAIARTVLSGAPGAPRTAVVLNAAAALVVAGVETDLRAAAEHASLALDSGRARDTLARWVAVSNEA
ncbi:MAG: anthranilate phosphoribosyltransferase [Deltaproteobacteria bacterium]|nr:anthranilate phosphoribosyltransferase [Deltaproteobacteria bacterium]